MSTDMTGWCALCRAGSHNTHNAALGGICVGCACPVTAADRPSVTDNARAVREAAMDLYRALRRTNPDALAEVDEVEDWTYWENIVRAAQVALAAARAETTPDEECGDYPAPCNCDDPETHDGAVTAADRPSVTDNARAEAMRRYPSDIADRGLTYPTGAVREHSRAAFVAGAEWAAGRAETTTATTEDAARVLDDVIQHLRKIWSTGHDEAREVIDTAEELLAQALPRLLATARARPTRDEVALTILDSATFEVGAGQLDGINAAADAVLALYADQPTEAEAGARALEDAADEFEAIEQRYAIVHSPVAWLRERADRTRDGAR